jgi:hypothetical protein
LTPRRRLAALAGFIGSNLADFAIVLGREQPSARDAERRAMAIWYDTKVPIRVIGDEAMLFSCEWTEPVRPTSAILGRGNRQVPRWPGQRPIREFL